MHRGRAIFWPTYLFIESELPGVLDVLCEQSLVNDTMPTPSPVMPRRWMARIPRPGFLPNSMILCGSMSRGSCAGQTVYVSKSAWIRSLSRARRSSDETSAARRSTCQTSDESGRCEGNEESLPRPGIRL